MSVRYDPLLVRALAREIEARWKGVRIRRLGLDPERNAASVRFVDGSALLTLLHHDAGYVLACEPDPLEGASVRESRFGGARLAAVDTEPDERALLLTLVGDEDEAVAGIAIELHTNRWNVLALDIADGGWRVRYALRTTEIGGRRLGPGEPYVMPASTRSGIEEPAAASDWAAALTEGEDGGVGSTDGDAPRPARTGILRAWAWTSALNIDWLLETAAGSFDRYRLLAREAGRPGAEAWLLPMRWGAQPYPLTLDVSEARRCASLLDAGRIATEEAGGIEAVLARASEGAEAVAAATERERLEKRLRGRIRRASKRIRALGRQLEAAGAPEEPREIGHLLLARKTSVPRGTDVATIEGFDGTERVVRLDPALDAVENAERYFAEASRRERARERLPREIASAKRRLAELEDALERVERDGPTDELWEIAGGRPRQTRGERRDGEERLPYTTLRSSGGLEIRVGRGAKDNDDLTFHHSAPDDIWLHASQTSGAHVILRWGRRDENPPGRDLREAATVAAVNSGGRHSGSVSVVWTRRKYVRKPRKSPPGTVAPDRVQTIMVRPDEELVRRLRGGEGA